MATVKTQTVEQRLIAELRRKRSSQKRLEREIRQLELQINRVRRTGVIHAVPERLSSVRRLTVEAAIIERLNLSSPPETTADQLWPLVQALGVSSRSTLRSYLRRMKEKGIILSPSPGRWRLEKDARGLKRILPEVADALDRLTRSAAPGQSR
jgi:hypothetical protein